MHPNKCFLKTSTLTSKTYRQILTLSFLLFTLIFYLFSFAEVNATIRYVSKTGLSIPPYTSWETAADSIQKCINICVFGDTIYVANGVYKEQVVMIPGISLIGAGMDSCEINTKSLISAWNDIAIEVKDSCLVMGFKILVSNNSRNGMGIAGKGSSATLVTMNYLIKAAYGFFLDATFYDITDFTVYKNVISNVSVGIELFNSNAIVRSNTIYTDPNSLVATVAGIQIAAFGNQNPLIDSNYIENNNARGYGIRKDLGSSPSIKNNIIKLKGIANGGISSGIGGNVQIFNNSIIAISGYEGIYGNGSYLEIINNQISGKLTSYGINHIGPYDTVKNNNVTNVGKGIGVWNNQNLLIQYNNSWNNNINYGGFTPDSTNLSVDPMVMNDNPNLGDLDFHLQMFSPLIDAGDPAILDRDGSRSDIGLYGGSYGESYVYIDLPPRSPVNLTAAVDSNIVMLKWNKNTEADFSYYKIFYDTTKNFLIDSTKLISSQPDTFYYFVIPPEADSLYFKLTAIDNQGNESNPSEEAGVVVTSVKDEWKPVNNYILYQNYPNPFNPSTKIGYKLKERGYVKLYVYDIKGELVSVLVNQTQEAGYYEVEFDTGSPMPDTGIRSLASGVYIYQIFVRGENNIPVFSDIKKMMYVK